MLSTKNFYTVTLFMQKKVTSYIVLSAAPAQAKALVLERFPGTDIIGVERTFFPKIETRVYYHRNQDEYYIIPNSWVEGKSLKDEEEICNTALRAGVVLKHVRKSDVI